MRRVTYAQVLKIIRRSSITKQQGQRIKISRLLWRNRRFSVGMINAMVRRTVQQGFRRLACYEDVNAATTRNRENDGQDEANGGTYDSSGNYSDCADCGDHIISNSSAV